MKFVSNKEKDLMIAGSQIVNELNNLRMLAEQSLPIDITKLQELIKLTEKVHSDEHIYKCYCCNEEFVPGEGTHGEILAQQVTNPKGRTAGVFPLSLRRFIICSGCWEKHDTDTYAEVEQ